jgi:hypothetical protein
MSAPSHNTVLARNERLAWRTLDGQVLILFPEAGTLHRLNGTGSAMWEQLDGRRTLAEIGETLTATYEVDPNEAVRDLQVLAADLVDAGLVKEQLA